MGTDVRIAGGAPGSGSGSGSGSGVCLRVAKPCSRCTVPDVDPECGTLAGGAAARVWRALLGFRTGAHVGIAHLHESFSDALFFGQNLVVLGASAGPAGRVAVGDTLYRVG